MGVGADGQSDKGFEGRIRSLLTIDAKRLSPCECFNLYTEHSHDTCT